MPTSPTAPSCAWTGTPAGPAVHLRADGIQVTPGGEPLAVTKQDTATALDAWDTGRRADAEHPARIGERTSHLSASLVEDLTAQLRLTACVVVIATHARQTRADLADWPRLGLTPKDVS